MATGLEPGLVKELTEAKGDLAKHGVVLVRTVESELEPAMMKGAKESLEASPRKLEDLEDEQLDALLETLRKAAMRSSRELADLYIRLLGKLSTEYIVDLSKELEGIGQLFKWDRMAKAAEPLNDILAKSGFGPVAMTGPEDVSESFKLELENKWGPAFERFENLAKQAAERIVQSKEVHTARPKKDQRKR